MAYVYKVQAFEIDPATGNHTRNIVNGTKVSISMKVRYIVTIFDASNLQHQINGEVHTNWSHSSSPSNIKEGQLITSGVYQSDNTSTKNYYIDVSGTGQCNVVPLFTVTVGGVTATLSGIAPSFVFTTATLGTQTPPANSQIQKDIAATNGLSTSSEIVYNPCPNQPNMVWAALIISKKLIDSSAQGSYYYYYYKINYYKADGSAGAPSKSITGGKYNGVQENFDRVYDPGAVGPNSLVYYTSTCKKNAYLELLSVKSGVNCPKTNTLGNQSTTADPTVVDDAGTVSGFFNPPDHISSRSSYLTVAQDSDLGIKMAYGTMPKLGYIIQEKNSAKNLNQKNPNTRYGFRFMYNPTTIQYGTQAMGQLDYTTFSSDPATLIAGNTTVTLQLYLNRMPDMLTLDPSSTDYANWKSFYPLIGKATLPKDSSLTEWRQRGTEYDLEFLYRVVNGDPLDNEIRGLGSYQSADFGYITGAPFWLCLNDNWNYFCAISTITVTHNIFSPDMVPIFTTVDLTLVRYPTVADTPNGVAKVGGSVMTALTQQTHAATTASNNSAAASSGKNH